MLFRLTVPVVLGGVTFQAGEHNATLDLEDWFVKALVQDGALFIVEAEVKTKKAPKE